MILIQVQQFGISTRYSLEILQQLGKMVISNLGVSMCVCVCVCVSGGGRGVLHPAGFALITQKQQKLLPWQFAAFCEILLETIVPNLVSLTRYSIQIET